MKERQMRLLPEKQSRINTLHTIPKFKSILDRGIHSAIIVASDKEIRDNPNSDPKDLLPAEKRAELIDHYLDALCLGIDHGLTASDMGLWVQSCISFLSLVRNERERTQ